MDLFIDVNTTVTLAHLILLKQCMIMIINIAKPSRARLLKMAFA